MKKLVSALLFCLAIDMSGQSADSTTYSKFDIGFTFSPNYSYRTIKTVASKSAMKNFYDTLEVARYSYTGGVNILFHVSKNLALGSGFLFSDQGERTKKYLIQPVNNYVNHYYYIDVPLKANYYLTHKNVKFFITAGLAANIYLNSQTNTEIGNVEKGYMRLSSDMLRLSVSFIGGLGIDCPLTDRWYFRLEPIYRRSLTPVADAPLKKYFYSAGLNVGLFCKF